MHRFARIVGVLVVAVVGMSAWGPSSVAQISISEARQQGVGATVTVQGTVTRAFGAYARVQDDSGPTGASGLVVRQTSGAFRDSIESGAIAPGTVVELSGELSAFNGLLQINGADLDSYSIEGSGEVPDPQTVTLDELSTNGEDYESELVRVTPLSFGGASGTFSNEASYTVEGNTGTLTLRVQADNQTELGGTPIPEGAFAYQGVVGEFSGEYQLIPVRERDLRPARSVAFGRSSVIATEGETGITLTVTASNLSDGDEVAATVAVSEAGTGTIDDVTGIAESETVTFSGSNPSPETFSLDIVDDSDDTEGVERLEFTLSSDSVVAAVPSRFTLWMLDNDTAQAPIVEGDSSGTLVSALQQRYADPPTLGYDRARDSLYRRLYNEQDTVETIYSGLRVRVDADGGDASDQALDENVNTEHVWPRSRGAETEPALSNLHILAPARDVVNSSRSNYAFGEIPDDETDTWYFKDQSQSTPPASNAAAWTEVDDSPSDRADRRFEPRHNVKGDVARAVFYFAMAYPNRADLSFFDTQRETLLEWHRQDPVDATELRRMLRIATYQGNTPNPFVLDSTLAGRAYGDGVPEPEAISIQQAREQGSGTVTIEGVVTRVGENGPYLQDDTGGIYIFESEGAFGQDLGDTIRQGTRLEVTGTLAYFNGLLELTEIPDSGYEVLAQDESLPSAQTVTLGEIASNGEVYESEIVRVENVSIEADGDETFQAGGGGNYTIRDGTGSLTLRVPGGSALDGAPIPKLATFQGPLGQYNTEGPGADEPDTGYQLLAIAEGDLEGTLSGDTSFDITRSFGDPSTGDSYRLVAIPGQVNRPLSSTLSGENGIAWQAYWDDGSEEDFLVKFDGSDTFDLRPGRGFWLLGTTDWAVADTVNTVSVEGGAATVPVQDGWNIVSNPLPTDVSWSAVTSANGGGLQALWRWANGGFQKADTLASATTGEAFYFLNDQGLDSLSVPVVASGTASKAGEAAGLERAVTMVAERAGDDEGRVRVAEHSGAESGRDRKDLIAPPSRFSDLSLRLRAPFEDKEPSRQNRLARDVRPTGTPGHTYTLVLRADTATTVTLRAASLRRSAQVNAALLHPDTGELHNLRTDGGMTVATGPEGTRVQLLVGTSDYVEGEASSRVPETLTVDAPAPNPFRDQTTLRYALPEKQHVRIVVYDLLGRAVRTLVDRKQDAGPHQVAWTGQAGAQQRLASGTYLLRLSAGGEQHVEKVILVR